MEHYFIFALRPLLLSLFISYPALWGIAATKYVSNTGNNANTGNSWSEAWLTLQYAANQIAAGDTVWIADGTYVGFDLRTTGSMANPIVFIAAGNNATINLPCGTTDGINVEGADHVEINGLRVIDQPRNGIRLVNADFCIVRNNYCENNFERGIFTGFTDDILIEHNECLESIDEHGIYVSNSSDRSIIRYNICHHNNRGGIQINADASQGGDGISTDPEIYGNILYENGVAGGAAINLDGVQSAFIYNNLLYENHASGIALFQIDGAAPSINAVIIHNTIINADDARWCILAVDGSSGAQVFNNIIINQHPWRGSIALDPDAVAGFDSDFNIVVNSMSTMGDGSSVPFATWQGYGYDENSMLAGALSDLFIAPGSDYHLIENSQAIDEGNGTFAYGIDDDLEGTARPQGVQHDIGAYEYAGPLAIDEEGKIVGDTPKEDDIKIANGLLSWKEGLFGKLGLYTVDGKSVREFDVKEGGEFSFETLPSGVYLMILSDAHDIQWKRMVLHVGR